MTQGFGQMSSYASQVPPEDRWAIAAYVRALQLSQHARSGSTAEDRAKTITEKSAPISRLAE